MKSGHLSRYDGHLGKLNRLGRTVRTLLKVRREAKRPLLVGTVMDGSITACILTYDFLLSTTHELKGVEIA